MQRLTLTLLALAGIVGFGAWQQRSPGHLRQAWEYCTIQNWSANVGENRPVPVGTRFRHSFVGEAEICYQEGNGCRSEKVTSFISVVDQIKELYSDPYVGQAQQMAVDKALSKLGAEGWRLVGAGPDPSAVRPNGESSSTPVRSILYFERPKP